MDGQRLETGLDDVLQDSVARMSWDGWARLRRDPADILQVSVNRPHLVVAPGEQADLDCRLNLLAAEPSVAATQLLVELRSARGQGTVFGPVRMDVQVPINAAEPLRRLRSAGIACLASGPNMPSDLTASLRTRRSGQILHRVNQGRNRGAIFGFDSAHGRRGLCSDLPVLVVEQLDESRGHIFCCWSDSSQGLSATCPHTRVRAGLECLYPIADWLAFVLGFLGSGSKCQCTPQDRDPC
jgi:hypothetical protein